ncbi:MAG: hypothetical protein ACK5QT_07225 [Oligoflexia bacterium]
MVSSQAELEGNNPSGEELIRSISAISGLAEESIKSEVSEMLSLSGRSAQQEDLSSLSLEQLRAAMLVYLETINADMEGSEASDDSSTVEY